NDISSTLVVYDYKTGKEVITTELYGNFSTELLFVDNNIFAVSNSGTVYKFNQNAWILWGKDFNIEVSSNPIADKNNLYFASSDGKLFSIDLKEGNLNFSKQVSKGFQSGISISSKNLYIGDDEGTMFSLDKRDGKIQWSFSSDTKIVHSPAIDGSSIFFGNLDGDIFSLNKYSGKLNWISNSKGLVNTAPLVLNNCLIQPNLNKHVDVLNKDTGELIQNIKFDGRCRTTPIFYNGDVFLGVDKGEVFSYKLN
ncbi:MAG: PQQ-binding-like beta-propeller repeat protein, partial [Ignavibacteriae bacterium]|nr:PQQ-binding-like beta-propeller repeat protein [Ignavibacteriota bacterium]